MAKVILEFEGPQENLDLGVHALAVKGGWSDQSQLSKLETARQQIALFVRETIASYQLTNADAQTLPKILHKDLNPSRF